MNELPEQIAPLFTFKIGRVFTVTLLIADNELTQPFASVPVTEYELVTVGDTIELPLE